MLMTKVSMMLFRDDNEIDFFEYSKLQQKLGSRRRERYFLP